MLPSNIFQESRTVKSDFYSIIGVDIWQVAIVLHLNTVLSTLQIYPAHFSQVRSLSHGVKHEQ